MAHKITEEEYRQIKEIEAAEKNKKRSRKYKVIIYRYEKKKNREIAEKLDLSEYRVSQIVREFKEQGIEKFIEEKQKGNHRNMSVDEENNILEGFEERSKDGELVTVQEIKEQFDKKLGRDTGRGYIYMLLERHGWRKVKPRPRHPKKASDEEIDASKKLNLNTKN